DSRPSWRRCRKTREIPAFHKVAAAVCRITAIRHNSKRAADVRTNANSQRKIVVGDGIIIVRRGLCRIVLYDDRGGRPKTLCLDSGPGERQTSGCEHKSIDFKLI